VYKNTIKINIKIGSLLTARKIVFSGKKYLYWLPYDYTLQRAKIYFSTSFPFDVLERGDKEYLEKIITIRNALAHRSNHSKKQFNEKVIDSTNLLPQEKTPSGFLRAILSLTPQPTTYFETYLDKLAKISKKFSI